MNNSENYSERGAKIILASHAGFCFGVRRAVETAAAAAPAITLGPIIHNPQMVAELERDGLVYSQRTAGRFVTEDRAMIEQTKKALAECHIKQFLESMDQLGFQRDEVISLLRQETGKEGITDGSSGM